MERALNKRGVYLIDKVLYLGQEGVGDSIRVAVAVEIGGKVTWQQEWVREQLLKKESNILRAHCLTFEEAQDEYDSDCRLIREEINRVTVVYLTTEEADIAEKRGRHIENGVKRRTKD